MKYFVLALAAGLLVATGSARADKKDAAKSLEGTWLVSEVQSGDDDKGDEHMKGAKLTLGADGKASFVPKEGDSHKGTFKVDTAKKPWTIDLTPEGAPGTMKGVYSIDGDTLKIAMSEPDGERPTGFKLEKGSKVKVLTLKREKR